MNRFTVAGLLLVSATLGGCMTATGYPAARNAPVDSDVLQAEYGSPGAPVTPAARKQAAARRTDSDVVRSVWGPQSDPYAIGKPAEEPSNSALGWN